ncbi:hypothetical protein OIU78_026568 [Salix suchowensis]|nr:hypothetical protein OIU78_026568 [Salix suchowensis]
MPCFSAEIICLLLIALLVFLPLRRATVLWLMVLVLSIMDNQTINLLPFLKPESSPSSKIGAIIGGAAGGAALVLLVVGLFVWFKLSKKRKAARRGNIFDATELRGATNYSYKDLKLATKKFKEANKLGGGGFGDVYKGTLKNGKVVAVKKLALGHSNRVKADFASEVTLISNVHHRNLMENSSPDRFLFGNVKLASHIL